jgi:CRISPR-associated endonuclease Cas3-HD
MTELFAKSKDATKYQQPLDLHLRGVGLTAERLARDLSGQAPMSNFLRDAAFTAKIAGFLHDIGKLDSGFQRALNRGINSDADEQEDSPPSDYWHHEIVSTALLSTKALAELLATLIREEYGENLDSRRESSLTRAIKFGVLWHHGRRSRSRKWDLISAPMSAEAEFFNASDIVREIAADSKSSVHDRLQTLLKRTLNKNVSIAPAELEICRNTNEIFPRFRQYSFLSSNPYLNSMTAELDPEFDRIPNDKFTDKYVGKVKTILARNVNVLRKAAQACGDSEYSNAIAQLLHQPSRNGIYLNEEYDQDLYLNALCDLVRCLVIQADWEVSQMGKQDLEHLANSEPAKIRSNINQHNWLELIPSDDSAKLEKAKLDSYRYRVMEESAKLVYDLGKRIVINRSCAGAGKTLWALSYFQNQKSISKIYWVCPRIPIVRGVYDELVEEVKRQNLSGTVAVTQLSSSEIVCSNEKIEPLEAQIIVTTFDFILSTYVRHGKANQLSSIYAGSVIFDEYHEIASEPMIQSFASELLYARSQVPDSRTVLLSATPSFPLLASMGLCTRISHADGNSSFEMNEEAGVYAIPLLGAFPAVFSERNLKSNPVIAKQHHLEQTTMSDEKHFYELAKNLSDQGTQSLLASSSTISKTVRLYKMSQNEGRKDQIFHGQYYRELMPGANKSHWTLNYEAVMAGWGKASLNADGNSKKGHVWSAQMLKASLNVSTPRTIHLTLGPDSDIQLYGRNDRFARSQSTNKFPKILMVNSNDASHRWALDAAFDKKIADRWFEFIREKLQHIGTSKIVSNSQLYAWYDEFALKEWDPQSDQISWREFANYNLISGLQKMNAQWLVPRNEPPWNHTHKTTPNGPRFAGRNLRGEGFWARLAVITDHEVLVDCPTIEMTARPMDRYFLERVTPNRKVKEARWRDKPFFYSLPESSEDFKPWSESVKSEARRRLRESGYSTENVLKEFSRKILVYHCHSTSDPGLGMISLATLTEDVPFWEENISHAFVPAEIIDIFKSVAKMK